MLIEIVQYQLAGVFVGDLDFLANFLGQQGASAKWLCPFCLACQDRLSDCFRLGSDAPRFGKRKGMNSIPNCFATYKREYLNILEHEKTKAKREHVTKELSYSIVALPLADIPPDCIASATMHVILGVTKKIYEWLLKLFVTIEQLEEQSIKERQHTNFVRRLRRQ